ncbi:hypothetical protein OGATHE_004553 [Ogataea polymorpha]|uniref:Uncharacterized protein n=1 Tax=Ogataea polymorpha TaxID=460523 RepID=A0A9P8P0K9_9ASCO|nr:hypothetical protein OGATHE_004553 [Ogataea polymorpha]
MPVLKFAAGLDMVLNPAFIPFIFRPVFITLTGQPILQSGRLCRQCSSLKTGLQAWLKAWLEAWLETWLISGLETSWLAQATILKPGLLSHHTAWHERLLAKSTCWLTHQTASSHSSLHSREAGLQRHQITSSSLHSSCLVNHQTRWLQRHQTSRGLRLSKRTESGHRHETTCLLSKGSGWHGASGLLSKSSGWNDLSCWLQRYQACGLSCKHRNHGPEDEESVTPLFVGSIGLMLTKSWIDPVSCGVTVLDSPVLAAGFSDQASSSNCCFRFWPFTESVDAFALLVFNEPSLVLKRPPLVG